MPRKPLIEPGSVLPPSDTLTRIIERDRANSGRLNQASTSEEESSPEKQAAHITSNITAHEGFNKASNNTAHKATQVTSKEETHTARHQATKTAIKVSAKEVARKRAQELAASRPMPITLRLPEGLNDWLDDYAHAHRKEGVKKQDLIARAVQLLVIEVEGSTPEEGEAR